MKHVLYAAVDAITAHRSGDKSLRVEASRASIDRDVVLHEKDVYQKAKKINQTMTEEIPQQDRAQYHFEQFMKAIGQDPDSDEHLEETPRRVTQAFRDEFFSGVDEDPRKHLERTFEDVEQHNGDAGFVIVDDIQVQSVCAHHWLPISGRAHIGYLPRDEVVGLSKIARVVEGYARRPQVQERLTNQVANAVQEELDPLATFVIVEADHGCMSCRGVREPFSSTTTSACRGPEGSNLEEKFYTLLDL